MTTEVETIELSPADGQILSVSVYGSRAELVRSFKFSVKKGQNQVHIQWLPWVMDTESFRVEGRGSATILDVKLLQNQQPSQVDSPELAELELKKKHVEMAVERCQYSITSLKSFLGSLNTQHTKASDLISVLEHYNTASEQQDKKLVELQQRLKEVDTAIQAEKKKLSPRDLGVLGRQAFIGLIAEEDANVELILKYAVTGARWSAAYDVRVDTNTPDKPVTLIYKAMISQNTHESWENVPVTLETVTPTHGVALPSLSRWAVSVFTPRPPTPRVKQTARRVMRASTAEEMVDAEESDEDMGFGLFDDDDAPMDRAVADISSKGSLSTTFRVPGLVTIPPGNTEQTFTIVELQLDARITWFTIPKVDTRVHLKADVHNDSAYTLLPGNTNVYVDGSFISKSRIPSVSPLERFDCALGVDPSVRITYHPIQKNTSTTGFYSKSTNYVYVQRITIENTRTNSVPLLKVVDQIPVSENSQVVVKLVTPTLKLPQATPGSSSSAPRNTTIEVSEGTVAKRDSALPRTLNSVISASAGPSVKIAEGVFAQWDGADEKKVDLEALGKNGKVNWICDVPPQEKLNFALQWEISAPSKTILTGL